jgi:hypothetical protein
MRLTFSRRTASARLYRVQRLDHHSRVRARARRRRAWAAGGFLVTSRGSATRRQRGNQASERSAGIGTRSLVVAAQAVEENTDSGIVARLTSMSGMRPNRRIVSWKAGRALRWA